MHMFEDGSDEYVAVSGVEGKSRCEGEIIEVIFFCTRRICSRTIRFYREWSAWNFLSKERIIVEVL